MPWAPGSTRWVWSRVTAWSPCYPTSPKPSARCWLRVRWEESSRRHHRILAGRGLLDRFAQVDPKILIACDGYRYDGKRVDIRERIGAVVKQLPTVEHVVIVPYMDLGVPDGMLDWSELFDARSGRAPKFRSLPFDHPLYIMFTSGTTGTPKCIVHRAGGTLLQHLKEHRLIVGLRPDERVFYFTTCGWMMWNWLVSALACEATVMLYDGSPFYPDGNRMFDFVQDEGAMFFGTSAKFIDSVTKAGLRPAETHPLPDLETIASTGSPLVPESFDFVYEHIEQDVALASISGGTDLLACFVGPNPQGPVYRGEIQGPALGMAVEIWNDAGERVIEERGELVCTQPFPTVPLCFWNDPDGTAYEAAYFDKFPGIWCHGDFAMETRHGGYLIMGRSDAVLNPGGVRIGTARDLPAGRAARRGRGSGRSGTGVGGRRPRGVLRRITRGLGTHRRVDR